MGRTRAVRYFDKSGTDLPPWSGPRLFLLHSRLNCLSWPDFRPVRQTGRSTEAGHAQASRVARSTTPHPTIQLLQLLSLPGLAAAIRLGSCPRTSIHRPYRHVASHKSHLQLIETAATPSRCISGSPCCSCPSQSCLRVSTFHHGRMSILIAPNTHWKHPIPMINMTAITMRMAITIRATNLTFPVKSFITIFIRPVSKWLDLKSDIVKHKAASCSHWDAQSG